MLVYQYRDPNPEIRRSSPAYINDNLQRSLGGYVRYSLSDFPISALINDDFHPFPLASAIALKFYNGTDEDEETDYFYQPYHTDVDCFTDMSRFNHTFNPPLQFAFDSNGTEQPFFRERSWDQFTDVFDINPGGKHHIAYLDCVYQNFTCKYVMNLLCM